MLTNELKPFSRIQQEHMILPEVRPHHKGVLLLDEAPTKGWVSFDHNTPQADHQGQGNLFST
jgi:hypothetical protein